MKQITRKIHFFKTNLNQYKDNTFIPVENRVEISRQVFSTIHQLPFDLIPENPSKYLTAYDENVLFMKVDNTDLVQSETIDVQFAISRRNLLPLIEDKGVLTDLTIPTNAGIAEITHFVYFLNDGIIGVEFNFYGPRATRIGFYIQEKTSLISQFLLTPILQMDVTETLKRIDEVSLFRVEAHTSATDIIKGLNEDLGSAFEASAKVTSAETVEIVLRKKKYSKKGFSFPIKRELLIEKLNQPTIRDNFNRFGVEAYDQEYNRERYFDLLEDKYIFTKKVIRQGERSRSINTISMYTAIKESYREHRQELISR